MSTPSGRGPQRRTAPMRVVVAVLLVLLSLLPATPASAAEPLEVRITGVRAAGTAYADRVTVTGTVTNRGPAPLTTVRAQLWRSHAYLHSYATVRSMLTGSSAPRGETLAGGPPHSLELTVPGAALAAGGSASFTLSATLEELGLIPDASYWIGATVTGTPPSGPPVTSTGRGLVTLPGTAAPTVASVVLLSARPRLVRPGVLLDDGLAAELAAGGRLRTLVDAAREGRSWIIDPALYTEVVDMADGYRVLDGAASKPGTGAKAAQDWLAALRALPRDRGYRALFGVPDLVGALAAGDDGVLSRSWNATEAAGLDLPTIVVTSRMSADVLHRLERERRPVLTTGLTSEVPWIEAGGTPVVAAVRPTAAPASPLLGDATTARITGLLALNRAAHDQVRLLASADDVALDRAALPDWLTRRTLSEVMTGDPVERPDPADPAPQAGELTRSLTGDLTSLAGALRSYAAAAPAAHLGQLADAQTSRAASETWWGAADARAAYLAELDRRFGRTRLATVTLTATGTVTMSSERSEFPATVANGLADPIRVRIVGDSDNSTRVRVLPTDVVTIRPNDKLTIPVTAEASANGVVGVRLTVVAEDGTPLTQPTPVTIEATNLGVVGWIIVLVSGAVLVVTTLARIRQVRSRKPAA